MVLFHLIPNNSNELCTSLLQILKKVVPHVCYGGPIKKMDAKKAGGQCCNLGVFELQGALSREREKCIQRIIGLLCQVYDAVSLFYAPCLVFFYPTIDLIFSARLGL